MRDTPLAFTCTRAEANDRAGPRLSFLPESTGGEAWGCKDSREGGFQVPVVLASTVLRGNQKQWSARWGHLIQIVERRFLCFVSLSPLDKEMKSRHGQWLIVIKNIANIEPALT